MSKVQDPEELAQELSASLTRCVPGYCAGMCVAWVLCWGVCGLGTVLGCVWPGYCARVCVAWVGVICESPRGCCVQWRTGCTVVFTRKHLGQVGRSGEGRQEWLCL